MMADCLAVTGSSLAAQLAASMVDQKVVLLEWQVVARKVGCLVVWLVVQLALGNKFESLST